MMNDVNTNMIMNLESRLLWYYLTSHELQVPLNSVIIDLPKNRKDSLKNWKKYTVYCKSEKHIINRFKNMQVSWGMGVQHHTKENPFVPSTQLIESGEKNLQIMLIHSSKWPTRQTRSFPERQIIVLYENVSKL